MGQEPDIDRLRDAATRLAAELDEARLYRAAAYASMAGDAIVVDLRSSSIPTARDDRRPAVICDPTGSGRAERPGVLRQAQDERGDVDLDFTLDEQGRVWMIREGDCHILGRTEAVCAEMRRFLAGAMPGEDRPA